MKYRIEHETPHRIRLRLNTGKISGPQADILRYAFGAMKNIRQVKIYPATAGVTLEYETGREEILRKLDAFSYENVRMMTDETRPKINAAEMRERKLDASLKNKLRRRVLLETAADVLLPMPVQVAYHAYQLVTLKNL